MTFKVLSVQPSDFTDKSSGEVRKMWRVYCADSTGAVGSVYSSKEIKVGENIDLVLSVNREGKFVAKIQQTSANSIDNIIDSKPTSTQAANSGAARAKIPG